MSFFPSNAFETLHGLVLGATSTKSSSSSLPILILLLVFLAVYMLWIRPQRMKLRQNQAQQRQAEVGDEVVTTGGIVGRIRSMSDDRVTLEIAPGTTIEIIRAAIGRRIDPPAYDQANGADRDYGDGGPKQEPDDHDSWPGPPEGSS